MTTIDYRLFDADEHYYEPEDALTRHLDRKYRSAVRWVDMDGRRSLIIGGKLLQLIPNPTYDPVGRRDRSTATSVRRTRKVVRSGRSWASRSASSPSTTIATRE